MDIFTQLQLDVWRAEMELNGETLASVASGAVQPLYPEQSSDLLGQRTLLAGLIIPAEAANDA